MVALLGLSKHYYFVLCSFATSGRLANMQHGTSCGSNFGEQLTAQCWGTTSHLRINGYLIEAAGYAIMGTHKLLGMFGLLEHGSRGPSFYKDREAMALPRKQLRSNSVTVQCATGPYAASANNAIL